jgi:predicted amidohydrolase YtcJ
MANTREAAFRNAAVWWGNPIRKIHGGMRIRGGQIIEIFENGQDSSKSEGAVDLDGMHIIPGLTDAHRHFSVTALMARHGDAGLWKSRQDALNAIEEACRSRSQDEWVFFSRMDHSKWKKPVLPTLREIDSVAGGRKVFISDITLHMGLASSEAVKRAGLNRESLRFPEDMDTCRSGELKGTLWEEAHGKVLFTMYRDVIRDYGEDYKREIILDEARRCLSLGLTHVHDPGLPWDIQILLKEIQKDTPLKLSWSVTTHENLYTPPGMEDDAQAVHSDHAPKSVKFFLDGAHRTAASMPVIAGLKAMVRAGLESLSEGRLGPLQLLFEQKIVLQGGKLALPYLRFKDTNELTAQASFFADKGYRLVIHALGNIAALQAAQVIKAVRPAGGASVEHMLVLNEGDIDTFAETGAVASIQPGFIPGYADSIERMGAIPYMKTFPLKSLLKRGVPICISSDGPCGPDDPLFNARRAVDRKKTDGSMLDPDERISREDALAAATIGGSLSVGIGNDGLSEGAPATFCIVNGDPFSDSSSVIQTWIDGVRVF